MTMDDLFKGFIFLNIEPLTVQALRALREDADKLIKLKKAEERKRVIKELRQLAKDNGYDLDDLMGKTKKSGSSGKQPPKYKDPDTDKTWSGKGPAPKWAKLYKEQGRMGELEV